MDGNGVANQDRQRSLATNLRARQVRCGEICDSEQANYTQKTLGFNNSEGSSECDETLPCCSSDKQNTRPVIYHMARARSVQHGPATFDEAYRATFRDSKALFLRNTEPSSLKRTLSESDIQALEFAGKSDALLPVSVHFSVGQTNVNSSDEELLRRENSLRKSDAGLQTEEINVDFGTKPNGDAETVKKYNAVLANLRKTCDLANSLRPCEDNDERLPEISEEDCLSVDELLLLINSYEQLNNEKRILEDENRIFGMEIDELATRLIKAEEQGGERSLPSISEENLQEQLAEMEDRLEAKEAELSKLRKALLKRYKREEPPLEKFMALRDDEEIAEKTNDLMVKNVELLECWETADCTGHNGTLVRHANPSVVSELDVNPKNELRPTKHQEYGYNVAYDGEIKPKLPEKGSLVPCTERIVASNKDAVYLSKNKFLKAELCHLEQDLSEMVASIRPEISRLEAENGQLREEMEKWKRLKHFQVDDAESMFCVQERLASEIEQLSRKLESTTSELAVRDAAYRQLEAAYRHLEQEKDHRVNVVGGNDGDRETDSIVVDVDVVEKVVEKVCLLQTANSNLVEGTVKLALQLEAEDLNCCAADETLESPVADWEATEREARTDSVSGCQPQRTHDFVGAWQIVENGADKNSSEANGEQEMIVHPVVLEAAGQVYRTENGDSEPVQSRSTEVTRPAIDAGVDDGLSKPAAGGKTTHSTVVDGATKRPLARDLVCNSVVQLF